MTARARPARARAVPPICTAIERAWLEAGISQQELADRVKVSQSMVNRWLTDREPSFDMVKRIERALRLPKGDLWRTAGYVDGEVPAHVSVVRSVANDELLDARGREVLLATYRALVTKR